MDREQYEKELKERQQRHLQGIFSQQKWCWKPCLHDSCQECHGTGIKQFGGFCVHAISCDCPKCSAYCSC